MTRKRYASEKSASRSRSRGPIATFLLLLTAVAVLCTPSQVLARFPGDVIGRELAMPGLGWLGHIAMDTGESVYDPRTRRSVGYLLEVLNEGSVIYKNTYTNFMSRSEIWNPYPLRYVSTCERCSHSWRGVINAGWEQRNWSPSYTYAAGIHRRENGV